MKMAQMGRNRMSLMISKLLLSISLRKSTPPPTSEIVKYHMQLYVHQPVVCKVKQIVCVYVLLREQYEYI